MNQVCDDPDIINCVAIRKGSFTFIRTGMSNIETDCGRSGLYLRRKAPIQLSKGQRKCKYQYRLRSVRKERNVTENKDSGLSDRRET